MNPQMNEVENPKDRAYADGYYRRSPERRREDGYPTLACWHEHRRGEDDRQADEEREVA